MNLNQEITMTMKLWEIVLHHVVIWGMGLNLLFKIIGFIGNRLERYIFRKADQERAEKMLKDYRQKLKEEQK